MLAGDALHPLARPPRRQLRRASCSTRSWTACAALLRCAVAAADERVGEAWAREPAAAARSTAGRTPEIAEDRIGLAVRRWRRVLEELAEEEVRELERSLAPDPETVAALLAAALLGGRRARRAGERLAERIGAQGALRLRDQGGELVADVHRPGARRRTRAAARAAGRP